MTATAPELIVDRRGDSLWLTINRPAKRNALSLAVLEAIGTTLEQHAADDTLRYVVITGAGERCFAAGGDLQELDQLRSAEQAASMSRLGRQALDSVRWFPLPVIAALNGPALGGGAELALACDVRIGTPTAEIGFLQASLNVTPAWGGAIDLVCLLGPATALPLLLDARRIDATEALRLGLLNRVCAAGETLAQCLGSFTAHWRGRPVPVIRRNKALAAAARRHWHEQLRHVEEAGLVETWIHPDHWAAAARALAPRRGD